jgi:hypothetical protein
MLDVGPERLSGARVKTVRSHLSVNDLAAQVDGSRQGIKSQLLPCDHRWGYPSHRPAPLVGPRHRAGSLDLQEREDVTGRFVGTRGRHRSVRARVSMLLPGSRVQL